MLVHLLGVVQFRGVDGQGCPMAKDGRGLIPLHREAVERFDSSIEVVLCRARLLGVAGDDRRAYVNKTFGRFLPDLKAAIADRLGQGPKSLRVRTSFFHGSVPSQS